LYPILVPLVLPVALLMFSQPVGSDGAVLAPSLYAKIKIKSPLACVPIVIVSPALVAELMREIVKALAP
jgi:hypothetical protein